MHPRHDEYLALTIPVSTWEECGPDHDPGARLVAPTLTLTIDGFSVEMFVEALAVQVVVHVQCGTEDTDEMLDHLHQASPGDGAFQTLTINGREYVVAITPHRY